MPSPRARLALLLGAVLLAGGLTVPALAGPAIDGSVTKRYTVPTAAGPLYLEVVHPTAGGKVVRAHGILTLSPYSALGRNGDADRWVPRGYARMYADVIGTGNSGGCYDYGGDREKASGHDLVEWVAKQPWSLGRVGMIGGSYDGTTATATAVTRPKGLATIVPEAAISRWYDYAYGGGIRYTHTTEHLGPQGPGAVTDEGFDTPLAFDGGLAVPPPLDVDSPDWAERVQATMVLCDEVAHLQHGYSLTPDYDAFWQERDYARVASRITVPVLVAHNWGDWNVKQDTAVRLFGALTKSPHKKLFMGTRWDGHGTPGGDYDAAVDAWMDRWVKGVPNRIETRLPQVTSQTSSSAGPGAFLTGTPKPTAVRLSSDAGFALVTGAGKAAPVQLAITGAGSEAVALSDLRPGVRGGTVTLLSAPLTRDVRLYGSPVVRVAATTGREWLTLTPAVVDVGPDGRSATDQAAVTRGWLDTRYSRGLDARRARPAGDLTAAVVAGPTDYVFTKGHRIALVLQTESVEWSVVKPYDAVCTAGPACATWSPLLGPRTSLELPLVAPGPVGTLFAR